MVVCCHFYGLILGISVVENIYGNIWFYLKKREIPALSSLVAVAAAGLPPH
jgi:hypothetical protein